MCVNACVLSTCLHTDVYSIHTIMTGPVRHVLTLGDEVTGCVCVVCACLHCPTWQVGWLLMPEIAAVFKFIAGLPFAEFDLYGF